MFPGVFERGEYCEKWEHDKKTKVLEVRRNIWRGKSNGRNKVKGHGQTAIWRDR